MCVVQSITDAKGFKDDGTLEPEYLSITMGNVLAYIVGHPTRACAYSFC